MNNTRRKELRGIMKLIEAAQDMMTEAAERIEAVMDEEQECFDNLPEGIQMSERGEHMEECIDNLSEIIDMLDIDFDEIDTMISDM